MRIQILVGARSHRVVLLFLLATLCAPAVAAQLPPPPSAYERASNAFQHKDFDSAAELFALAEQSQPRATDALLYRAKALLHLKRFADAEVALRDYRSQNSGSADATFLLGYVLFSLNRPSESLAIYTQGAQLRVPNADDLKIVGLNYVLLNDNTDAAQWLGRAVELDPANIEAWYSLGRVRYSQNLFMEARTAFTRVLALDARNVKAQSNLGLLEEAGNHPEAAIAAYRKAIAWQASDPHPSEQPFLNLGVLLLARGEDALAVTALQEAERITPRSAAAHGQLGRALLQVGQTAQAQTELEAAVRIEPENPRWHYQLGQVFRRMGSKEHANAEFVISERLLASKSGH